MQMQREMADFNTITHYDKTAVIIQGQRYEKNLIIGQKVILEWPVAQMEDLSQETLAPILALNPKVILLGRSSSVYPDPQIIVTLAQQKIGIECMTIDAACRTFNLLLSEGREVVTALIF
jgi:uncharacterized protein